MRLVLIFAFVSLAVSASCHGQLGQSEAATTAAYGKPLSTSTLAASAIKIVTYRTDSYTIVTGFKAGKAIYLIYKKNSGARWTDAEIKSVLDGHRLGHSDWGWSKSSGNSGPAVHTGGPNHINAAEIWNIFAQGDYSAEYYPEKALLLIRDATGGLDTTTILEQNSF